MTIARQMLAPGFCKWQRPARSSKQQIHRGRTFKASVRTTACIGSHQAQQHAGRPVHSGAALAATIVQLNAHNAVAIGQMNASTMLQNTGSQNFSNSKTMHWLKIHCQHRVSAGVCNAVCTPAAATAAATRTNITARMCDNHLAMVH